MPPENPDISFFARKYKIPTFESDSWNKEWEQVLYTLSAAEDIYPIMGTMWNPGKVEPDAQQTLKDLVCQRQRIAVELWDKLGEGIRIDTLWLLLAEQECKRHLLRGLRKACKEAIRGQDARALCPEITVSFMLKQRGKAFINFVQDYSNGKKDVGEEEVYLVPNAWWKNPVDMSASLEEEIKFQFTMLSMERNEFISLFISHTLASVLQDLYSGGPGIDPVLNMMKDDGTGLNPFNANVWAKTLADIRDKPLIRCESCGKTSENIEGNVKFMVCSKCKAKLNFSVHYCSQACQKEDWRNHKKHCGKKKVLKNIEGTAEDPFWNTRNLPEHVRQSPPAMRDGIVDLTTTGLGVPHPLRPHSPALQRQVSLINADHAADYFLFDEMDLPVRVVLHEMWTKMSFRALRADAMFSAEQEGVEAMAEYLIKVMGNKPGLSKQRILDQFSSEYGKNMTEVMVEWERLAVRNGFSPGTTLLEVMSKNNEINTQRMDAMQARRR